MRLEKLLSIQIRDYIFNKIKRRKKDSDTNAELIST